MRRLRTSFYVEEEVAEKLENLFSGKDEIDGKYMILLARAYANRGELSEGEKWCGKAIDSDRINPDYLSLSFRLRPGLWRYCHRQPQR